MASVDVTQLRDWLFLPNECPSVLQCQVFLGISGGNISRQGLNKAIRNEKDLTWTQLASIVRTLLLGGYFSCDETRRLFRDLLFKCDTELVCRGDHYLSQEKTVGLILGFFDALSFPEKFLAASHEDRRELLVDLLRDVILAENTGPLSSAMNFLEGRTHHVYGETTDSKAAKERQTRLNQAIKRAVRGAKDDNCFSSPLHKKVISSVLGRIQYVCERNEKNTYVRCAGRGGCSFVPTDIGRYLLDQMLIAYFIEMTQMSKLTSICLLEQTFAREAKPS